MYQHDWVPSTLGHGETMCSRCKITNREAAVLGEVNCPKPPVGKEKRNDQMTTIKVIPKPIEFEAFQFIAGMKNEDLPESFRGGIDDNYGRQPRIYMNVGGATPRFHVGSWFVKRKGMPWRKYANATFHETFEIKAETNGEDANESGTAA